MARSSHTTPVLKQKLRLGFTDPQCRSLACHWACGMNPSVPRVKSTPRCLIPSHIFGPSKRENFPTSVQADADPGLPLAALVAVVPKDKLTLNGPTKSWAGKGSSGKDVHRIFCSECGSPIAHDPDAAPEIIAIKAGTLDTEIKKTLKPDTEIWTKSKLPFMKETLAKPFEGMPE